jgi:hypothetical protein
MSWLNLTQPQAALFAAALGATGAILGGMVAAILSQVLGGRVQRRRQWDEIRHVAYARVAETFHTAWSLYDHNGRLRADPGRQRRAAEDLLGAYSRAVLLTRTDAAAAALEGLHEAAQDLWDRPARPWHEIDDACRRAERTFRREARAELGLSRRHGIPAVAVDAGQAPASGPAPVTVIDNVTANVASADEAQR